MISDDYVLGAKIRYQGAGAWRWRSKLAILHRVHECSLYLVENDDSECKDECGEACGVAECGPAEFTNSEHAEFESFDNACERVCLHEYFESRVFDGAERINYGCCVHPKLNDKAEQKGEVTILCCKATEQYSKSEGESCNECDERGSE